MPAEVPSRTNDTRELFTVVRRYLAEVTVWLYSSGELLPLTNVPLERARDQIEHAPSVPAEEPVQTNPSPRREPQPLHLAESSTRVTRRSAVDQDTAAAETDSPLADDIDRVTAEELHMLFDHEAGDGSR
jgi:hypothetical protein